MAKTYIAMEAYDLASEFLNKAGAVSPGGRERVDVQLWRERIAKPDVIDRVQHAQLLQYIYL